MFIKFENTTFWMNAMPASGKYPWIVVPVVSEMNTCQQLEQVSLDQDISELARFSANLIIKNEDTKASSI